jgi:MarR family transcriptional regulator, transcriptional regulator for hemolysin
VRPSGLPIGLQLAGTARLVSRAFDQVLAEAGGSLPVWLVLLNLKIHPTANQRELATAVGVREATLTHHLNAMERDGLVTRRRDEQNRRVHVVELTGEAEKLFRQLARAASAFDGRLREGIDEEDVAKLGRTLEQLAANIASEGEAGAALWSGALEKR